MLVTMIIIGLQLTSLQVSIPIKKQVIHKLRTYYLLRFKNQTSRKQNIKDENFRVLTSISQMKQPVYMKENHNIISISACGESLQTTVFLASLSIFANISQATCFQEGELTGHLLCFTLVGSSLYRVSTPRNKFLTPLHVQTPSK